MLNIENITSKKMKIFSIIIVILTLFLSKIKTEKKLSEKRIKSAMEIISEMKAGWNLGNSLESEKKETYWGNPKTTQKMIDSIINRGFSTIRIPIRWDDNYIDKSKYIISKQFLDRVEEVVKYSYKYGESKKVYTIINVHHNKLQQLFNYENKERIKNELSIIWKQISERFKKYNQYLIFEIINEPRDGNDWNGNKLKYDVVNEVILKSLQVIRQSGENNNNRLIMLTPYAASKYGALNLPKDDKMIAVSIHAYIPSIFTNKERPNFTNEDFKYIENYFESVKVNFINKNIPVFIGEFGCKNNNNINERVKYVSAYSSICHKYNIPIIWWDNGRKDEYGIFDRKVSRFYFDNIAMTMINEYKKNIKMIKSDQKYIHLFKGEKTVRNWDKAIKILTYHNKEGIFEETLIRENGYFLIEFYANDVDDALLIFQSWSNVKKWETIKSGSYYQRNGHFFVRFNYNDIIIKFNDISLLDCIYVSANSNQITLYNFWYYIS